MRIFNPLFKIVAWGIFLAGCVVAAVSSWETAMDDSVQPKETGPAEASAVPSGDPGPTVSSALPGIIVDGTEKNSEPMAVVEEEGPVPGVFPSGGAVSPPLRDSALFTAEEILAMPERRRLLLLQCLETPTAP